jgi:hypothetical protein
MFDQFENDVRNAIYEMYEFIGEENANRRSSKKLEKIHTVLSNWSGGNKIEGRNVPCYGSTDYINVDYTNTNNPKGIILYGLVKAPTQDIKSNQFNMHNTIIGEVSRCLTLDPSIRQIIHHTSFIPRSLKGKKGKNETITELNFDFGKSQFVKLISRHNKWFHNTVYYDNSRDLNFDKMQLIELYEQCCWIREELR